MVPGANENLIPYDNVERNEENYEFQNTICSDEKLW